MIKTTTALRRISGLKKRIWGIQGGQGAGKTFGILILIINHVSSNKNKEVYIVSAELSKMRDTVIKDCLKILQAFNLFPKLIGIEHGQPKIIFPNGSFIRFIGLDKEDVGKGLRSDIIFVNEANKINFETYRELTSRAKRVIIDFNPNAKFWFHTEVLNRKDCDFLVLTYKDNEYLSEQEIKEILYYKEKGYDPEGNIINEYWANKWRIYGLGEVGSVEGRIFNWNPISYNDWLKLDVPIYYSVDWGTSDPFAIGCDKYYDGAIYTHELNYDSENVWRQKLTTTELAQFQGGDNEGFVTWLFNRLGIEKNRYIVCDNNRPAKIKALRAAGWDYALAVKKGTGSIIDGIDLLQNLQVFYTENSTNIENEQEVYCWAQDRKGEVLEMPVDYSNHHIDRIRYMAMFLQQQGIITKI